MPIFKLMLGSASFLNAEIDPSIKEWVELLPSGSFEARDNRGSFVVDIDAVMAAFKANGMALSTDYEHQSLSARVAEGAVIASGDIVDLKVVNGTIFGKMKWTENATKLIEEREYKYISPVYKFFIDSDGISHIVSLEGAGLTNNPAFYLDGIASQNVNNGEMKIEESDNMLELMIELLGMDVESTEEDVMAVVKDMLGYEADIEAASTKLKQTESSLAKVKAAKDAATGELEKANDKIEAIDAASKKQAVIKVVDDAILARKVAPGQKDAAILMASASIEGFATWVDGAQELISEDENSSGEDELSDAQKLVNKVLG